MNVVNFIRATHPSVTQASLLFQHESSVLGLVGLAFTTNRINFCFDGLIFVALTLLLSKFSFRK